MVLLLKFTYGPFSLVPPRLNFWCEEKKVVKQEKDEKENQGKIIRKKAMEALKKEKNEKGKVMSEVLFNFVRISMGCLAAVSL